MNIVITGVSSGFGKSICSHLLAHGHRVFGSVRNLADIEKAESRYSNSRFTALLLDVRDTASIQKAAAQVEQHLGDEPLHALINNAGIALGAPLELVPIDEFSDVFDTNVTGVLRVSQQFLPLLKRSASRSQTAKIINIGSIAGKLAFPFIGVYASSKHALEGLSTAMRRELAPSGVKVILVGPGSYATPIWSKPGAKRMMSIVRDSDYEQSAKKMEQLVKEIVENAPPPDIIAPKILAILVNKRPKSRYAIVPHSFSEWHLPRLLPTWLMDYLIARQLK